MSAERKATAALTVALLALAVSIVASLRLAANRSATQATTGYTVAGDWSTSELHTGTLNIARSQSGVAYAVEIPAARAGDVLFVSGEAQVTNEHAYNVFVGSTLLLAGSARAVTGESFTRGDGSNVTPAIHHGVVTCVQTLTLSRAIHRAWINMVLSVTATQARPGDRMEINPGSGQLNVMLLARRDNASRSTRG